MHTHGESVLVGYVGLPPDGARSGVYPLKTLSCGSLFTISPFPGNRLSITSGEQSGARLIHRPPQIPILPWPIRPWRAQGQDPSFSDPLPRHSNTCPPENSIRWNSPRGGELGGNRISPVFPFSPPLTFLDGGFRSSSTRVGMGVDRPNSLGVGGQSIQSISENPMIRVSSLRPVASFSGQREEGQLLTETASPPRPRALPRELGSLRGIPRHPPTFANSYLPSKEGASIMTLTKTNLT